MNTTKKALLFLIAPIVIFSTFCGQGQLGKHASLVFEKEKDLNTRIIGAIIDGKKQGLWINYDSADRIASIETYIDDSLTGECVYYFEDGSVSAIGRMKNGQRDGQWVFYYTQTKIAEKGNYKNGMKIGVWEYYIEEGNLAKKIEYLDDGKSRIVLDNHLTPPTPDSQNPLPGLDTNNRAVIH